MKIYRLRNLPFRRKDSRRMVYFIQLAWLKTNFHKDNIVF